MPPHHGEVQHYHHPGYSHYGLDVPERESQFDPLKILFLALRYRVLIATMIGLAVVSGVVLTVMQTPVYQASARVEIVAQPARVLQELDVMGPMFDFRDMETAREKFISHALAERTVYQLGLADKPDFLYPASGFSFWNLIRRAFGLNPASGINEESPQARREIAVGRVLGGMSVNTVGETRLLKISYNNQNPGYAREVANQIARSYIDQQTNQTGEASNLARQFVQEQVQQVKERLQQSEQKLVNYAREVGITVTGDEKSLIVSNINAINAALSKAIEERLERDLMASQIALGRGESLNEVLSSDPLQKLRSTIAERKAEYQQKLATFKPDFPEMRQLQAQVRELERQYRDGVAVILDNIGMKRDEAIRREADLRAKLAELEKQQIAYEDKNIQYTILKREVDSNRSQYDSLMAKLNEIGVGAKLKTERATIVDLAEGAYQVEPKLSRNLLMALALFLALGAIIIYILELLNNTFTNPDQIEKELGLPVLGILPRVEEKELIESLTDPKSSLSESYRSLRTSIQFSGTESTPRTLMVTSSEPSEAKSTTSYKLALDFGALGKRVVIVDADMRKPSMHRKFGLDNTLGLSNLLTNSVRREDMPRTIRETGEDNVWIVRAGTIPPNPADLLSSTKMALLIEFLEERFDVVIIDSPPVIGLSDAPILSRIAQATLLLVSANNVSRKSAKSALKRLRAAGANIIGASMTKFTVGSLEYNYAYKYMNYDYYQYGHETPRLEGHVESDSGAGKYGPLVDSLGRQARDAFRRIARRLKPAD